MDPYNWFCFRTVLPKKQYLLVDDANPKHVSFFKEGEPLVVIQKLHAFHDITTDEILRRLSISSEEFAHLLKICKLSKK